MIQSWKSATLWAVILWVLIFVEVSVVMFIPIIKSNLIIQKIIHLLILPFLVVFCSYMYFKNIKPALQDGLILGVYFLIIGTILDLIITIPLFVKSFNFFLSPSLWLGFLEVIIFSTLTGYFSSKK